MNRSLARELTTLIFAAATMVLPAAPTSAAQTVLMVARGGGTDAAGVRLTMISFALGGSNSNEGFGFFKAGKNRMILDEVTQVSLSGSQVTVSGDARLNGTPISFLGYFTDNGGEYDDYVIIRYGGYTWWQGYTDGDDIKIRTFGRD